MYGKTQTHDCAKRWALHIKNHEVTSELLIFRGTSSSEHSIHDMTTLCSDYRTMYVFGFSNLRQYVRQFSLFVRHLCD